MLVALVLFSVVEIGLLDLLLRPDPTKFVHGYPGSTLESHISLLVNAIVIMILIIMVHLDSSETIVNS
ncbi:hypothetical protein LINPERHAP1_LOCUS5177 [Linum perenne]